ncbi:hypothetical protein ABZ723_03460 [Streptomyces sp. NPDC006700]|uniref:hypothetical protein n=1 Tax=Streptomyces sp. NPDC006700 TaxID=3154479 RepID=UPI0033D6D274
MNLHLINDVPDGLTRRARSFVSAHGVKVDVRPVEGNRQWWLERDIPAVVIDRMAAYQELSLFRFDGHHRCGGQAAGTAS